jgi:hypothetical protein
VKVLRLYDGGSSDEDCSKEQLETLYGHLDEIEVILRESGIRSIHNWSPEHARRCHRWWTGSAGDRARKVERSGPAKEKGQIQ